LLGMIHPKLRTAFLLQEFLKQEGKTVEVRVGSPVPAEALSAVGSDREAMEYLRWRTYLLARRRKAEPTWPMALRSKLDEKQLESLMRSCEDTINGAPTSARETLRLVRALREIEARLGLQGRARDAKQNVERA